MLALIMSSFLVTVVLIETLRRSAGTLGLLEQPGEHRTHLAATPLVGGIAIFGGILTGWMFSPPTQLPALLLGGLVVASIGVWDDRHQTSYLVRFGGQIAAAMIMVAIGGVTLQDLGHLTTSEYLFYLGRWSMALTIFAAVGVMNALNMSDGMDGLAGSLSLVTVCCLLILAMTAGHIGAVTGLVIIAAAIAGFLVYNVRWRGQRSAVVFMGDGGSLLLGFLLAWYLIGLSQGGERAMSPVTALWIFALPLFDAVGVMLRRAVRGQSPFKSDREHYHHYLLALGLSVKQVLAVVVGTAVLLASVGLVGWYLGLSERWLFYAFLGVFIAFVITTEYLGRRQTTDNGLLHEAA
jgi:UDP-GlcNAc:undecaprenyl-phosphate GlcNAc-1-phosphate transferase